MMRSAPRFLVPEVVQTSAMDCGPAALKALFEGFRLQVSYGRLREACQTSVDGTSVDALEEVANQLGLSATQSLLPFDLALADQSHTLPAMAITRLGDGATHFVVLWRRHGDWLQVMDPGTGRRWVRSADFARTLYLHEASVAAQDWRDWAATEDFQRPLRHQLASLGVTGDTSSALIGAAMADQNWFGPATLDAAIRLTLSLSAAGGLSKGIAAARLIKTLYDDTMASPDDIYRLLPSDYWRVSPDPKSAELGERRVLLSGAVLVTARRAIGDIPNQNELSSELRAAVVEPRPKPLRMMWHMIRRDGLLTPLMLVASLGLASALMLVETVMLRAVVELGGALAPGAQRLATVGAILALMGLALAVRMGIVTEALRMGRVLDVRLRMALLDKLPRLSDRYFHSRPISDMADRGHSLHLVRAVPGIVTHFLQTSAELTFMIVAILLLDWQTGVLAAAVTLTQIGAMSLAQPFIGEADLKTRNHASALYTFYLDALLGAVPIRVHNGQRAVRRQQEGMLTNWVRASRKQADLALVLDMTQQVVTMAVIAGLMGIHFWRTGGVSGSDLLLCYWLMKLPVAAGTLAGLAHAYPALRNVLLRLNEPLTAPETRSAEERPERAIGAASVQIRSGTVVAGGNTILDELNLNISPGEHVAIVGPSGAGKSSLVGLLLGWHALQQGSLLVDGKPLDQVRLETLRTQTAWVDPAVQLWNRSLADNVAYASPQLETERIEGVIAESELDNVLRHLPAGLATILGEGGGQLSGGEGQRVRLARALAQEGVRLALLDEPFRGLDRPQRLRLLQAVRRHWATATLIHVSHDIAETAIFTRVLVVEDGRVVEDGDPREMRLGRTRYAALLRADQEALHLIWGSQHWRRINMEDGIVRSGE